MSRQTGLIITAVVALSPIMVASTGAEPDGPLSISAATSSPAGNGGALKATAPRSPAHFVPGTLSEAARDKSDVSARPSTAGDLAGPADTLATEIDRWVGRTHWASFGSMSMSRSPTTLTVYSTSPPPPGLLSISKRASGVKVRYVRSRYSSERLLSEAARLMDQLSGTPLALASAGADRGDNGLEVTPLDVSLASPSNRGRFLRQLPTSFPARLGTILDDGVFALGRLSGSPVIS